MNYTEIISFLQQHSGEDPIRLLLQQDRYPNVDLKFAAQQLEGRRQAQNKWPSLLANESYLYPPKLNREQSSSEATARYKAQLLHSKDKNIVDLTGGMGIDTIFLAHEAKTIDYVEQEPMLCDLFHHNTQILGIDNISIHQGNSIEWIAQSGRHFDIAFIDPARRSNNGRKVSAFEDCTPNILLYLPLLLQYSDLLTIKASPMCDISLAISQLQTVSEIHIVALRGECKEVIFIIQKDAPESPLIHCVNLQTPQPEFSFTNAEEQAAIPRYCQQIGPYIYEPHAALMKGGPFHLITQRFGVEQLGRNSHLYTSERQVDNFPGRTWKVVQEIQLNKKSIKKHIPEGKAHVVSRNYPVEASTLQKQLGLREGGTQYIIASSLENRKIGLLCQEV